MMPYLSRFLCLLVLVPATSALSLARETGALEKAAPTRPNIVLILSDDSGYSDLGCYGGEIRTPVLDRLAQDGLRFTDLYSNGRCWPSRTSLMSAYYPQQLNMDPIGEALPEWTRFLPERLNEAGYRSFHAGKWHINLTTPEKAGFLTAAGLPKPAEGAFPPSDGDSDFGFPHSEAYADEVLAFLHDHATRGSDQPFFVYLAFQAPHFPVRALPEDIEPYLEVYTEGWDAIHAQRAERVAALGLVETEPAPIRPSVLQYKEERILPLLGPDETLSSEAWDRLSPSVQAFQARKMAIHAAMMTRMDTEIGRVVAQLGAMDALENTLIIYLSDNGATAEVLVRGDGHDANARMGSQASYLSIGPAWAQATNSPFSYYKMYAHEGGIASPGIFHWPKAIEDKGALRRTPAHFIDVAATILDLAGLEPDIENAPGTMARSLLPVLLRDDAELPPADLYFRHRGKGLRAEDWKVVSLRRGSEDWALYDMRTDRGETKDLSTAMPELRDELVRRWNAIDEQLFEDASYER